MCKGVNPKKCDFNSFGICDLQSSPFISSEQVKCSTTIPRKQGLDLDFKYPNFKI